MAYLNSRGHEVVSSLPFEPAVRLNKPPRETIDQQLRRMILIQQMERDNVIKDEADFMEDLNDFSDPEVSDNNVIGPSSYEIPDDVPDGFSAADYRQEQEKKNSPKPEDSGTESSVLAGE